MKEHFSALILKEKYSATLGVNSAFYSLQMSQDRSDADILNELTKAVKKSKRGILVHVSESD